MEWTTELIASLGAALVAVVAAIKSAESLSSEKRRITTETVTRSRIEWSVNVRSMLSKFIKLYVKSSELNVQDKLAVYYRISIHCHTINEVYRKMLVLLKQCALDTEYNDEHLEKLITEVQIVFKEIWERAKEEAGIEEVDEQLLALKFRALRQAYIEQNIPVSKLILAEDEEPSQLEINDKATPA